MQHNVYGVHTRAVLPKALASSLLGQACVSCSLGKCWEKCSAMKKYTRYIATVVVKGVGWSLRKKPSSTAKHSRFVPKSLNDNFQNNRVRSKTTHRTRQALPACCGGEVWSVPGAIRCWVSSEGCDDCPSRVYCLLLLLSAALASPKSKWSYICDNERSTRHCSLNLRCFKQSNIVE